MTFEKGRRHLGVSALGGSHWLEFVAIEKGPWHLGIAALGGGH
jgi:hypothetical protein